LLTKTHEAFASNRDSLAALPLQESFEAVNGQSRIVSRDVYDWPILPFLATSIRSPPTVLAKSIGAQEALVSAEHSRPKVKMSGFSKVGMSGSSCQSARHGYGLGDDEPEGIDARCVHAAHLGTKDDPG
jgi:hypothetical protein